MKTLRSLLLLLLLAQPAFAVQPATQADVFELRQEVVRLTDELDDRLTELEFWPRVLLGLFGLNALGLPALYFLLMSRAKKMADARLAQLIAGRHQDLCDLIDERSDREQLKHESRLVIVADRVKLHGQLRDLGFPEVQTLSLEEAASTRLRDFDAVIFDLEGGVSTEAAAEMIRGQSLDYALVFSPGRVDGLPNTTAFANSPMTLFARLMELLTFRAAKLRS